MRFPARRAPVLSRRRLLRASAGLLTLPAIIRSAGAAETKEIRIAVQFGINYLPLLVMREHRLYEEAARAAGLPTPTVTWNQFSGGAAMNEALLSGSLDFATAGVAPVLTAWSRTRGNVQVKAVAPLAAMPSCLVTNRPNIRSLRDFAAGDRIAVPAVKVSFQSIILQMAAEQVFGTGEFARLDPLTVSLSHPDAMAALLTGREITAHFSNPPFQEQELKHPNIHRILSSYEVVGGAHTSVMIYATSRFRDANRPWVAAFIAALERADAFITGDPRAAAQLYAKTEKSELAPDFVEKLLRDPQNRFSTEPQNIMAFARFQHHTGQIATVPESWRELFFPELTVTTGS